MHSQCTGYVLRYVPSAVPTTHLVLKHLLVGWLLYSLHSVKSCPPPFAFAHLSSSSLYCSFFHFFLALQLSNRMSPFSLYFLDQSTSAKYCDRKWNRQRKKKGEKRSKKEEKEEQAGTDRILLSKREDNTNVSTSVLYILSSSLVQQRIHNLVYQLMS